MIEPLNRHGALGHGVRSREAKVLRTVLYQWCGDLFRPYSVF